MKNDAAFILALLLAALAGWVDAAGFSDASPLFLSFMSGNTVTLAVSLTHRNWSMARTIGAIIGLFTVGVTVGEAIRPAAGRFGQPLILALEALLLALAAALHVPSIQLAQNASLYPVVFAMGLQNATVHRAADINISLTYVTGTLVQVGRSLAGLVSGTGDKSRLTEFLAAWLSLGFGAALGTLALSISLFAVLATAELSSAPCLTATARSGTI